MSFVFLSVDSPKARSAAVPVLQEEGVPFIDVGMGLIEIGPGSAILGQLRVVTVTTGDEGGLSSIPMSSPSTENVYDQNIQVCELNALNAAFAVMRWKRLRGFYVDSALENVSVYHLDGNTVINERR
jgi:hypothetical protein